MFGTQIFLEHFGGIEKHDYTQNAVSALCIPYWVIKQQ